MKHRNPFAVFFLPFITLGIYSLVWEVKTKNEMNRLGADIPTAWLLIIPIVSLWWLWKYCEGVEKITNEKLSGVLSFILLFLLGSIGAAIIQDSFNKASAQTQPMGMTMTPNIPMNPVQPDNSFGGPIVAAVPTPQPQPTTPAEVASPVADSVAPQPPIPPQPPVV